MSRILNVRERETCKYGSRDKSLIEHGQNAIIAKGNQERFFFSFCFFKIQNLGLSQKTLQSCSVLPNDQWKVGEEEESLEASTSSALAGISDNPDLPTAVVHVIREQEVRRSTPACVIGSTVGLELLILTDPERSGRPSWEWGFPCSRKRKGALTRTGGAAARQKTKGEHWFLQETPAWMNAKDQTLLPKPFLCEPEYRCSPQRESGPLGREEFKPAEFTSVYWAYWEIPQVPSFFTTRWNRLKFDIRFHFCPYEFVTWAFILAM